MKIKEPIMVNTSVCLASYNGENYIKEQIKSILQELSSDDELVVVDDCSTDRTIEIIKAINDPRIKLHPNELNIGVNKSFEKAISLSKNDYIFLSDQDDIWTSGRVSKMISNLEMEKAFLVTSNFSWIDENNNPIKIKFDGVSSAKSKHYFSNIIDIFIGKTNYFGCAMAFKRDLVSVICPIPDYVESHDLWIAIASNILKKNSHMDDNTFLKRKHNNNATSTVSGRPFKKKLISRFIFFCSIVTIYKRLFLLRTRKALTVGY